MPKHTRLLGYDASVSDRRMPAGPPGEDGTVEFIDAKVLTLIGDNEILEYPMTQELATVIGGKLQGQSIEIAQAVPNVPFLDSEQHRA
jgi:hypothetical protein